MFRYLLFVIPLTVLLIGGATLGIDALDAGEFGPRLEGKTVLGGWLLEATALAALFLLVQGRGGSWWLDGLLTGLVAWVFRGPVLVLTVAEELGRSGERLWSLTLHWLVLYAVAGLLLAFVARRLEIRR